MPDVHYNLQRLLYPTEWQPHPLVMAFISDDNERVIFQALFQSAQHIYEKWEGSGSGSGRPQNMRILHVRIRIPNTGTSV